MPGKVAPLIDKRHYLSFVLAYVIWFHHALLKWTSACSESSDLHVLLFTNQHTGRSDDRFVISTCSVLILKMWFLLGKWFLPLRLRRWEAVVCKWLAMLESWGVLHSFLIICGLRSIKSMKEVLASYQSLPVKFLWAWVCACEVYNIHVHCLASEF